MVLDDRLYGETDDSCALCGFRNPQGLTVHHIDEDRANNTYENQMVLCHTCHQRYHQNKGISRSDIEQRKRHLIQKTVTTYGISAMKIASRNNVGVIAHPFLLHHLVDLGYMTQEEVPMSYGGGNAGSVDVFARFAITPKGRHVLTTWL